jgi:hypothetical protein
MMARGLRALADMLVDAMAQSRVDCYTAAKMRPWQAQPHATLPPMIHDLATAFLVAFAAVTASEVLTRIWEYL